MESKKEEIISEIQRIAKLLKQDELKSKDFIKHAKVSFSKIRYYFGNWNNAVKEAGLNPINQADISRNRNLLKEDDLLKDLIRLYNENGKEPTEDLINSKGTFSSRPYRARWGSINKAFIIAKKQFNSEIQQVSNLQPENNITEIKVIPETIKPTIKNTKKRTIFGEPIDFRGLRFAPVNEQGVVYLFGMISHELGFRIESIRTEYPDCEGKRCFDKKNNQWEHIKIEFEYQSMNFKIHGHNEDDCDLIVCWEHNWNECPIEVLELKSVIKY